MRFDLRLLLLVRVELFYSLTLIQNFFLFFFQLTQKLTGLAIPTLLLHKLSDLIIVLFELARLDLHSQLLSRFPHLAHNAERRSLLRDKKLGLVNLYRKNRIVTHLEEWNVHGSRQHLIYLSEAYQQSLLLLLREIKSKHFVGELCKRPIKIGSTKKSL